MLSSSIFGVIKGLGIAAIRILYGGGVLFSQLHDNVVHMFPCKQVWDHSVLGCPTASGLDVSRTTPPCIHVVKPVQ